MGRPSHRTTGIPRWPARSRSSPAPPAASAPRSRRCSPATARPSSCVDIPAAGESLARNANRLGGTALQLDVTAPDAGRRIVDHARAPPRLAGRHGPQRGDHPRQAAGQHGRVPVGVGPRRQPRLGDPDERGDPGAGRAGRRWPRRLRLVDRRHRGEPRPDQLRGLQGGHRRPGAARWAARRDLYARRDHRQRGGAGLHRDRDDGQDPAGDPRARPAAELAAAGRAARSTSRRPSRG